MATNNSREKAQTKDFNTKSGAAKPGAEGQTPQLNKAQVLAMLKREMPTRGPGGEVKTIDDVVLTPTPNQRNMVRTLESKPINFIEGVFGTGKTVWTCEAALRSLIEKKSKRICINAPAVTAGEDIGYLKGTMEEKMLVFVNQILEAFDELIGEDLRNKLIEAKIIKIEPHAFLRGRSMRNTFFILDECQNASGPNLKTALTRVGEGSTFVFMGDNGQNDRTEGNSAYKKLIQVFTKSVYSEYVGHAKLTVDDVKRHPFLKLMVENGDDGPLEGYETHKGAAPQPARPRPA
jgi:phosphate starvation-inducible PhoH-like protein